LTESWFEVAQGPELMQGDVLLQCPIYRVETAAAVDDEEVGFIEELQDVIVLTQSCDLENDKVSDVLVAYVHDYVQLAQETWDTNPAIKSTDFRKGLIQGTTPPYSLLPQYSGGPQLPWSLVDFHHVFSIPKVLAARVAEAAGPRLRLLSPYREHLAQAFARYIMRVGLPYTLHDFQRLKPDPPQAGQT
jgi:hypothetical protein